MCRTQGALALLALYVGLANSFAWDIVMLDGNSLEFYNYGRLTHKEHINWFISKIAYDPVHDHVLLGCNSDSEDYAVASFDITTKKIEPIITIPGYTITGIAFDPPTETIFWVHKDEQFDVYSFSFKSGLNNSMYGIFVLEIERSSGEFRYISVDSCGRSIYWVAGSKIEKAKFDGSEREVVIDLDSNAKEIWGLAVDQQKLYWIELERTSNGQESSVISADLNGQNKTTLYSYTHSKNILDSLTVSNDFIYGGIFLSKGFWHVPKVPPYDGHVIDEESITPGQYGACPIAAKHTTPTKQSCEAVQYLPNDYDPYDYFLNDFTDVSLLCVHGTKVNGVSHCECKQGYSGNRCDVSLCHNYCFQGDCSFNAEGQPTCRCNAGYTGERCLVNACQDYCLGNGVCSLNKKSEPVCQCTRDYEGERCDIPVFLVKCLQTVSMLRDFLNTDLMQVTPGSEVKLTCALTTV